MFHFGSYLIFILISLLYVEFLLAIAVNIIHKNLVLFPFARLALLHKKK